MQTSTVLRSIAILLCSTTAIMLICAAPTASVPLVRLYSKAAGRYLVENPANNSVTASGENQLDGNLFVFIRRGSGIVFTFESSEQPGKYLLFNEEGDLKLAYPDQGSILFEYVAIQGADCGFMTTDNCFIAFQSLSSDPSGNSLPCSSGIGSGDQEAIISFVPS